PTGSSARPYTTLFRSAVELRTAVAAAAAEHVAGQALGVDAHQHRLVGLPGAFDERYVLGGVDVVLVRDAAHVAAGLGGNARFRADRKSTRLNSSHVAS